MLFASSSFSTTTQSSEKSRFVFHIIHGNERTRRRKRKEFFWRREVERRALAVRAEREEFRAETEELESE